MISPKMQDAYNEQIREELFSAYLYMAMSAYFESLNLKGFAKWMTTQSQEEVAHAMKFYHHILERGGKVELKAIDKPKTAWDSPLNAFEEAYQHEQHITDCINKLAALAKEENDLPSHTMLHWFIDEQVEEEASTSEVAEKLKMIGDHPQGLFMMDGFLGKRE